MPLLKCWQAKQRQHNSLAPGMKNHFYTTWQRTQQSPRALKEIVEFWVMHDVTDLDTRGHEVKV